MDWSRATTEELAAATSDLLINYGEMTADATSPDLIFVPITTWWSVLYDQGKARYRPRVRNRRRVRRQKRTNF